MSKERIITDDAPRTDNPYAQGVRAGDTLYVSGTDSILAYKLSGGTGVAGARIDPLRWQYSHDGSSASGVSIADGAVFAAIGDDQRLLALE